MGTYFSILKAVAAGNRKSGEIAAALNVRQTGLSKYLKVLERLDVLERVVPVTEENPEKSKKGLYRIKDNYLRFWFRFVFPQMGLLETGRRAEALKTIRNNFVDGRSPTCTRTCAATACGMRARKGRSPSCPSGWALGGAHAMWSWTLWGWAPKRAERCSASASSGRGRGRQCAEALGRAGSKGPGRPLFSALWRPAVYVLFSIGGFTDEVRSEARARKDVLLLS